MNRQIILASTSPRRRELFKILHIPFKAVDSGYEEVEDPRLTPEQLVRFLAEGKARAAGERYPQAVIVAADTMVVFGGKALGKPKSKAQADRMLASFSGKSQQVITGAVVYDASKNRMKSTVVSSKVYFRNLTNQAILDYIETAEPFDKAGGYGPIAHGFNLLEKMKGDFTNIFGLPMGWIYNQLQKCDIHI